MKYLINLIILSAFWINGCSNAIDPNYNQNFDKLTNLDTKSAIALGNDWHYSSPKIKTHVTQKEAIFEFPDGRVVNKELPSDLMYIAIAPYIEKTHTCTIHYPSSCDGELKEKTFRIKAVDENGNIILYDNINTMKNGFFELWLPRNKNINLSISYNSLNGSEIIPTKEDSRTCITTIMLK